MTASETRAFSTAAAVLLVASTIRYGVELRRVEAPMAWDTADALPGLLEESRARGAEEALRNRPLGPGERLDPNRASEVELDRLPGVGPGLARAIVEARSATGGFRSLEDLLRVRGIGPATLAKVGERLDLSTGVPLELDRAPQAGQRGDASPAIDLNRADSAALQSLSGVGPALARRILRVRERSGGFRSVDDLLQVRGIGQATLDRLRPHVKAGPARRPLRSRGTHGRGNQTYVFSPPVRRCIGATVPQTSCR